MQLMNVGIYPYCDEFKPFLRHMLLLNSSFQLKALIAPAGWGLTGQTIITGTGNKGWTVISEFESVIHSIDTIFIPEFHVAKDVETLIIREIEPIIPHLKRIICAASLNKQNETILQTICMQAGCILDDLNLLRTTADYSLVCPSEKNPPLKRIDVPVVAVAGLWEEMDKFEVSLVLREIFIENGYRVTQIGSRNCCEIFGFHSFPSFMVDSTVDAADKVFYLNQWICLLKDTERPDVILLTVPGAIQNYNERFTNGFGILPHVVFQAIMADFLIFCTMYDFNSIQFLQEISTMCRYRFGCEIDCYHMSNLYFDINESEEQGKVIVNRINREIVSQTLEENFKDSQIPIINILEQSSRDKLFGLLLGKLSGEDFQIVL